MDVRKLPTCEYCGAIVGECPCPVPGTAEYQQRKLQEDWDDFVAALVEAFRPLVNFFARLFSGKRGR